MTHDGFRTRLREYRGLHSCPAENSGSKNYDYVGYVAVTSRKIAGDRFSSLNRRKGTYGTVRHDLVTAGEDILLYHETICCILDTWQVPLSETRCVKDDHEALTPRLMKTRNATKSY